MLNNKLIPLFTILLILIISNQSHSKIPKKLLLRGKAIAFYTPHLVNPKMSSYEFGFITRKRIKTLNYRFNAFCSVLALEEFYKQSEDLRAGALGFKGGTILPSQPWWPIYFQLAIGYAKTALHKDPWFGKNDSTVKNKHLFFTNIGLVFRYKKKLLFRVEHQFNSLDYFSDRTYLSIGGNF